jgi:hypothetical protein
MPDLCETFRWQAGQIWNRMAKAASVRIALSEETITETALYEMALARHGDSTIAITLATKPQEARHGGDWEWWLIAGSSGISFRVQAKRLFQNGRYQSLLKPAPHPYAQLDKLARPQGAMVTFLFIASSTIQWQASLARVAAVAIRTTCRVFGAALWPVRIGCALRGPTTWIICGPTCGPGTNWSVITREPVCPMLQNISWSSSADWLLRGGHPAERRSIPSRSGSSRITS